MAKQQARDDENPTMMDLKAQLVELKGRVTTLEAQHGAMAMFMPREQRRMTRTEVETKIKSDPTTIFEVVSEYRRAGLNLPEGKLVSAQHYPDLAGHVSSGLKICVAAQH